MMTSGLDAKRARLISDLTALAEARQIPPELIREQLAEFEPDHRVVELSGRQPEFERTVGDYVTALVSDRRINDGRALRADKASTLAEIEARFGVPPEILLAVWGIESNFGSDMGSFAVIPSLATLALQECRRRAFWLGELAAALQIVASENIASEKLVGSWAGAMGHMQFIPSTYQKFAVDHDGDGRRDIWSSVPDALASAAHYLQQSGWQASHPWGALVKLPDQFDYAALADNQSRPVGLWRQSGIAFAIERNFAQYEHYEARLLLPAGGAGPAFLVTGNFDAILTYNGAVPYALAVGHLSDRIRGHTMSLESWPDESPLSKAERTELQERLVGRGYETGGVDGIFGRATREAVRDYQIATGLLADSFPGRQVLDQLRNA